MFEAQLKWISIDNHYKTIYGSVRSVCSVGCQRDTMGINSTHLILDIEEIESMSYLGIKLMQFNMAPTNSVRAILLPLFGNPL